MQQKIILILQNNTQAPDSYLYINKGDTLTIISFITSRP